MRATATSVVVRTVAPAASPAAVGELTPTPTGGDGGSPPRVPLRWRSPGAGFGRRSWYLTVATAAVKYHDLFRGTGSRRFGRTSPRAARPARTGRSRRRRSGPVPPPSPPRA